jgi:nucleoside-diphosphate-sugar epimerase
MILILGGLGFVGSAFARYFNRLGIPHQVVDKDNYADLIGTHCDVLINANGNSKKFLALQDPLREFDETVRSVRASLTHFKTGYYVHLSTCDVYPDCTSPQATQEDQEPDISKQSPYGFHKYLAEQCVRYAAPKWLIIRMGGFVGPGLRKNPIFDIMQGGPLWVDPTSELQYLHTEKNAEIVHQLIQKDISHEVINICGQGLVCLEDVIRLTGKSVEVKPDSQLVRYNVSIEKVSRLLFIPNSRDTVMQFVKQELGISPLE